MQSNTAKDGKYEIISIFHGKKKVLADENLILKVQTDPKRKLQASRAKFKDLALAERKYLVPSRLEVNVFLFRKF